MLARLALTLAAGLAAGLIASSAKATPTMPATASYQTSDVVPVAQGCGRGWHWSYRLRRCVRN